MKIYICEYCGKEHDGSYGSGRFCSTHCRCAYNGSKASHSTLSLHVAHKKLRAPYGTWKCEYCDDHPIFETRQKLKEHKQKFHPIPKGSSWNKGLTKETDKRLAKANAKLIAKYASGELLPTWLGKHHSTETK